MDGRDRGERGGRAGAGRLRDRARVERLEEPPHALRFGGALRVFDEDERRRHAGAPQRHRDRAGAELVGQGHHGGPEPSGGAVVMARRRNTMREWLRPSAVLVTLLAFALVGACAKRPNLTVASAPAPVPPPAPNVATVVTETQTTVIETPPPAAEPAPPVQVATAAPLPPPKDFAPNPALTRIHFDFDKAEIRPGDAQTLDTNANWLREHPDQLVLIEGHCDERGTAEYNQCELAARAPRSTGPDRGPLRRAGHGRIQPGLGGPAGQEHHELPRNGPRSGPVD